MGVTERDREHFRRLARASAELEDDEAQRDAFRDPGDKMTRGLELADFGIRMGAAARGSLASATSVPEEELLAQGCLSELWRARQGRRAP